VWTLRRTLLLVLGFALFFTTYAVYAHFLGGIDGLPELPKELWPSASHTPMIEAGDASPADKKLRLAFGSQCEEVKRNFKLEVTKKRMVLAAGTFKTEEGRVKFTPFSIAIFAEDKGDGKFLEINTIKSDVAFLTFDRPVNSLMEINRAKLIGTELRGHIEVTNNRRTPQTNDDLTLRVDKGPLFYDEKQQKIWTADHVQLQDTQTRPRPTEITGDGLELYLTREEPAKAGKPAPRKAKSEGVSGVDQVILLSNVDMHLYLDSNSGFLAEQRDPKKEDKGKKPAAKVPDAKATEPQKCHVWIHTQGKSTYDLRTDRAVFTSPAGTNPQNPDKIKVSRNLILTPETAFKGEQFDQLDCDYLEMQFRKKKNATERRMDDSNTGDREIESARATSSANDGVVLTVDTEGLESRGCELIYHAPAETRGPRTILRGDPLYVARSGSQMWARELILTGANAQGVGQKALAKGPGRIDLADHTNPKTTYTQHAFWKDLLVSYKDGPYDLLTLTGDASFQDEAHQQKLTAQRLLVWLEPADKSETAPKSPKSSPAPQETPRQRPNKLEAFEKVMALSPEINIYDTEHLKVLFQDAPLTQKQLPEKLPSEPDHVAQKPGDVAPIRKTPDKQPPEPPGNPAKAEPARAKKPMNLKGRTVVAYITRLGQKNELRELITQGDVHVHQEGDEKDKDVDIKGEKLNLLRYPQGDLLLVFGDSRNPARLQLRELFLVGPQVTINQKENTAEVEGVGAMSMPSKTTFDDGKPAKPGTKLTVHWNKHMFFDGRDATFHGGVSASQDEARMRCSTLDVSLDKTVSFKEGQKAADSAKVEKMVCFKEVDVRNKTFDKEGKLIKSHRLVATEVSVDNQQGPVTASGPGVVYILQKGPVDDGLSGPDSKRPAGAPAKEGPPAEEMKLTRVSFRGNMKTNHKSNDRITTFFQEVEVFHIPADTLDAKVDIDKLPPGGLYLNCDRLKVYSRPAKEGTASQEMEADGHAKFQTPEFSGNADIVKYNDREDQVMFLGRDGRQATIYNAKIRGVSPRMINGSRIIYNRKTKALQVDGASSIYVE
jgi:lipopolysaccharide export system protein LptA